MPVQKEPPAFVPPATGIMTASRSDRAQTVSEPVAPYRSDSRPGSRRSSSFGVSGSGAVPRPPTDFVPALFEVITEAASESLKIEAQLAMTKSSIFRALARSATTKVHLKFDQIVLATDFQKFVPDFLPPGTEWPAGFVTAPVEFSRTLTTLAEFMKLRAAGFVYRDEEFTMILFPRGADEWKFLDDPAFGSQDELLRFRIGPPIRESEEEPEPDLEEMIASLDLQGAVVAGELAGLDATLFQSNKGEQAAFIMMPDSHVVESDLLIKYFHGIKFKVYHSSTPGAWSYFLQHYWRSGTVILHPDIGIWRIPELHSTLAKSQAGIRFFALGFQRDYDDPEFPDPTYTCWRMLPHGRATLITDEVFVYYPQKAITILSMYLRNHKEKPPGGETNKIFARPGLKRWLLKLVEDLPDDGDKDYLHNLVQLVNLVEELCPMEVCDPWKPYNPLKTAYLVSESVSDDGWEEYDDIWQRDHGKGTNELVEWFAYWTGKLNPHEFRRINVCYEPRPDDFEGSATDGDGVDGPRAKLDPQDWAKRYQHLGVLLPEEVVKS